MCLCFFFQAEDGIRDLTVTGVQTCALPISPTGKSFGPEVGLLLSRPTTFQVIGVTVSVAWANIGTNKPKTAAPRIPILSPLTTFPLKQSLNDQNSNMCATDCTVRNSAEYHDQRIVSDWGSRYRLGWCARNAICERVIGTISPTTRTRMWLVIAPARNNAGYFFAGRRQHCDNAMSRERGSCRANSWRGYWFCSRL